jgi:aerobic C4-dicarboxylate transport protein
MANDKEKPKKIYQQLYFRILIAVLIGAGLGHFYPQFGADMKPFGDGFIKLIKMLLAPIIFATVVLGIARMGDMKEVGRVGAKALIYFEVVSTLALIIGLVVVNVMKPGAGMNVDAAALDTKSIAQYVSVAKQQTAVDFFLNIIPTSVGDAFVRGNMLQIILFSLLFGIGLSRFRDKAKPALDVLDSVQNGLFGIVGMVMQLAPLGAFGAMAFTVGKFGIGTLASLGQLIVCVYVTCLIFIVGVLGVIAKISHVSLLRLVRYIKEEVVITFATSSTEAVLPQIMAKLERLGCEKSIVGLVVPTGYTFNADGTSIYLTMAAIFLAQATNTPLTLFDQLTVLGVAILTSKGSAGVAGAGFVALAATLSSLDSIPVAGLAILLGVDPFINQARAVTNLIGNALATIVVADWEKGFDRSEAEAIVVPG